MKFAGVVKRGLIAYLVVVGVAVHVALLASLAFLPGYFQLTPRQFLVRAVEKSPVPLPWLAAWATPPVRFQDHFFDGSLKSGHPRILLPELANWNGSGPPASMAERQQLLAGGTKMGDLCVNKGHAMSMAACWVLTGRRDVAESLIPILRGFTPETPNAVGTYGDAWQLAFAYDLLATYPGLSESDKTSIEIKLEKALNDYLVLLDDPSPSLWHGRASLAAGAWLCAVVLNADGMGDKKMLNRAQGHFLEAMRAAAVTEAWPEGYNYWINNRAFVMALAGSAYLNGLEGARFGADIRKTWERIGLWHVYATRPDHRIEALGDEGPRVDLKDETERVIDVVAQLTRSGPLATFARYLEELHGEEAYYRSYRWGYPLFHDPTVPLLSGSQPKSLDALNGVLPNATLFGKGAMNLAFIRSGWGPDDTFVSFRAGSSFVHHGHYDAGHFTLFKGAPLAITSGTYGEFFSPHRLNYSIRTVATNSLLVMRPGEKVAPNRFFKENVADGGQRLPIPTGSAIESVDQWQQNIGAGLHLEGGEVTAFDHVQGAYSYIASDLTGAYNNTKHDEGGSGGKVRRITRELLYLADEDRLLVSDDIVSTDASYVKKWLLHTVTQPQAEGLRVLRGKANDGISETRAPSIRVANGAGRLVVQRLEPEQGVMRIVGGKQHQFYIETDGDDASLNGVNMSDGADYQPWFDTGLWRIEAQPIVPAEHDRFLMALTPSLYDFRTDLVRRVDLRSGNGYAVDTGRTVVVFAVLSSRGSMEFGVEAGRGQLIVAGLPPGPVKITRAGATAEGSVNGQGVFRMSLDKSAAGPIVLAW